MPRHTTCVTQVSTALSAAVRCANSRQQQRSADATHHSSITDPRVHTLFHRAAGPKLPVADFVQRLKSYFSPDDAVLRAAAVYCRRASQRDDAFLTEANMNRVFFAAFLVAEKFLDDHAKPLQEYADGALFSLHDTAALEMAMLHVLDFNAFVDPREDAAIQGAK